MPSPSATPTPITPPRVPLIDQRTGLIDRAWYMFFLGLFRTAETVDTSNLAPNTASALASYDQLLQQVQQTAQTQPSLTYVVDSLAELTKQTAQTQPSLTYVVDSLAELTKQTAQTQPTLSSVLEQLSELSKQVQELLIAPSNTPHVRSPRYGSFYDTTTQTAAAINTAYAITYNTTDLSNGVYIGSPASRVYVDRPGVYNIQFSAQLDNTSGGNHLAYIWLSVNGTDVPNSASRTTLKGTDGDLVAAWNFLYNFNAGDYFELMWSVADTAVQLVAAAAAAPVPAIPSVILTVTDNISNYRE